MKRKSIFILLSFVSFLSFGASTLEISPEHQTICTSGKDTAKFTLKANAFPTNSDIVIYKNTNNNFNPYNNEGEEIGRIKIKGGSTDFLSNSCPTILGIFIDACNAAPLKEQDNEYMIITSGNGFKVNDLGVDLPNSTNGANQDINLGSNPCKFSNTFDAAYLNTLRTGFCNASNLNFAKPGDDIPAGAIVIIFTGNGTSFPYNFSGFCQLGVPVYILQNNCFRSSGAFVNNNNNDACNLTTSNRYRLSRIINKSCIDSLTYDVCGLPIYTPATANDGDGNYVIRQKNKADTASIANNGIQNNAADKCNGVVADSLITNYTFNYPIASALCNYTIFVKAVGEPVALTGQVSSNEVSFYMACVDITTPKDRYEICSGSTSNINISTSDPNATISWAVSGGSNTSGQASGNGNLIAQTLTLLNNAIADSVVYTITASDNNCTKIKNVKVVINAAPKAFSLGKDSVHCTSINQVLNAGVTANWTLNGQSVANNQATYTATQAGTYKATISNQCGTESDEIILTQENISVQISATATEICNNTIDLAVQGQYDSIRWSNNSTASMTTITQEGSYNVVVYRNGCSAKASINITKCQTTTCNPTITGNLEFCQGGNTTLDAGAGFLTYVWSNGEQTQTIQVAQGGNYSVDVTGNNCTGKASVVVKTTNAPQAFTLGKDSVHCTSINQVLNAGVTANWTLNGQSVANNQATYTATQAGTYKATISNQCGTVSDEIILNQENVSVQILATATEICNNTIDLSVQGQYDSIRWSNNSTASMTTITQEGSYNVVVYRNGCSAKASINITKCQTTTCNPTITGNLEFCQGGNTTLDAGAGFLTYVWSTGEQTQTIQVAQGGNYSVDVTGNNCTGKASVEVKAINAPQAFSLGKDTTYCGNFSRVLNAGAAANWTLNGQSVANNQTTYTATQVGKYEATVSNQCGTETASINISQNQLPAVSLGADVLFCDDPVILTAQTDANNNVVWNTQESTHTITVSTPGIYSVKVTDANNCSSSDTVNVDLNCKNEVWVPNAFSPNDDGTNDVFYVRGNPKNTTIEDMQIVDRWGNIVFKAKNILPEDKTSGWDGMYKGKKQQLDVYGYYIKVKYKDGQSGILKGSLMLVE